MRFTYFGYDAMTPALQRLLDDGHELLSVFTFDADNVFNFNAQTLALAEKSGAPAHTTPPTEKQITDLTKQGCELFIATGYPFKIPPIDENKAYSVNVHPSLLPKGRSLMPIPNILLNHPEAAGITAHKITPEFDAGDILKQIPLTVHARETVETLSSRIAILMPDFIADLLQNLESYWKQAQPQNETEATHWPAPSDDMRTLHWDQGIEQIEKTARAFGRFGSLAHIEGQLWVIYNIDSWPETHNHTPGTIILAQERELIIAAKDGYICIKEAQLVERPA